VILDDLKAQFGDEIESADEVGRELRVRVRAASLVAMCRLCRSRGYSYLSDITAVDTGSDMRVVYRLVSLQDGGHVVISVGVPRAGGSVPSVTSVFRGANWPEREVYDLFGVRFQGHPDLRRILLTDDWQGYPMLKAGPGQPK
jgi:NADH-quinone oxidoreductase subunit C